MNQDADHATLLRNIEFLNSLIFDAYESGSTIELSIKMQKGVPAGFKVTDERHTSDTRPDFERGEPFSGNVVNFYQKGKASGKRIEYRLPPQN